MKKLGKLNLKQVELKEDEMKVLLGGKLIYYCTRMKKNYDGSITVFPFSTDNVNLANSWCAFWESAGWLVTFTSRDDGTEFVPYYV